jgi:hypothetical protein
MWTKAFTQVMLLILGVLLLAVTMSVFIDLG